MDVAGKPSVLCCPLCNDLFKDPRMLPCQHSFCEQCLSSVIKHINKGSGKADQHFPCPVCEQKTKIKAASSFQRNLTLSALLDSNSLQAKLTKEASRKRPTTVTIATQTSFDESDTDYTDKPKASTASNVKPCIDIEMKLVQMDTGDVKQCKRYDRRHKDIKHSFNVPVEVPLELGIFFRLLTQTDFPLRTCLSFLLLLDLMIMIYFLPFLSVLSIVFAWLDITRNMKVFRLIKFLLKSKIKEYKCWYTCLLISIYVIVNMCKLVVMILLFTVCQTYVIALYNALFYEKSVFSFEELGRKVIVLLSTFPSIICEIDQEIGNSTYRFLGL